MAPITAKLVTQNIPSLFDLTKPTMLRAFKVLEDVIRGEILMDEPAIQIFQCSMSSLWDDLFLMAKR